MYNAYYFIKCQVSKCLEVNNKKIALNEFNYTEIKDPEEDISSVEGQYPDVTCILNASVFLECIIVQQHFFQTKEPHGAVSLLRS
jgi:hypothetical protein